MTDFNWQKALTDIAPTIGTLVGGPLAGSAISSLETALGLPTGSGQPAVASAIQNGLTGDQIAAVQIADLQYKTMLAQQATAVKQIDATTQVAQITANSSDTAVVNNTMQTEAKSDHWPTYAWRPFIGFVFGITILIATVTVFFSYLGVMFFGTKPDILAQLPSMLTAVTGLNATTLPVLGIASYFRGKMQSDPKINTDNRG